MKHKRKKIKYTDAQYPEVSTKCVQLDDQTKKLIIIPKMQ